MCKSTLLLNKFVFRFIFIILFFFSYQIKNSHTQPYIDSSSSVKLSIDSRNSLSQKENLKILSWNIYMLPYIGSINSNSSRAESIGEMLSYMDYDIIVFEEAFHSYSRKIILKELGKMYPFAYGPVNLESNYLETNSGIWILSKLPLKLIKSIEYIDSKGFDAIAKKGAVLLEGIWNKKLFQLIGTHLQADEYSNIRKKQINQLYNELVLPYKNDSIPQIICGDFNINAEDSFEYFYMIKRLNANNNRSFSLNNISYDEINNKIAIKDKPIPKTLDYILISNETLNVEIERNIIKLQGYNSDGFREDLSDHYALEANIKF